MPRLNDYVCLGKHSSTIPSLHFFYYTVVWFFFFFNQQPEHIHPDVPSLRPFEEEFMVCWKLNGPGLTTMSVWANLHHLSPPWHCCRTTVCFFFPLNNSLSKIIRIYLRQGYSRRCSWSIRSYTAQVKRLCLSGPTFIMESPPAFFFRLNHCLCFFPSPFNQQPE